MQPARHSILLAMLALAGCGQILALQNAGQEIAELTPGNYVIDPDHAVILWRINHLGFSTFVGRFETFDASLTFDPERPEATRLDVLIETATVDSGVEALDEQLRGNNFLASDSFPQARFTSTNLTQTGPETADVEGNLTIRGITQPITLTVTYQGGGSDFLRGNAQILGFEGKTSFSRSSFGMDFLTPAVGDEVELEIFAEFMEAG